MKKLLNTLYVQTQETYLHRDGETVVAERDRTVVARVPIHTLRGIVCFGNVLCSPFLLGLCAERGVLVSFLTERGRFLARVDGPASGNVLLRLAQFRAHENAVKKADIAKSFVAGKLYNSRSVILRRIRDHGDNPILDNAQKRHMDALRKLREGAIDVSGIRGLEGEAGAVYFNAFNELLVAQKGDFSIESRNRRPPLDPMNALLSFLYTLLAHDCQSALESVGLDSQIGYLHEVRPGRPALALDLMEEFRSVLADRVALSLVNLRQLSPKDFSKTESGAVLLSDTARKAVLLAWQKKKQETVVHPFLEEKVDIGLLPHIQAQLLSRHLRGDLDAYPPYLSK